MCIMFNFTRNNLIAPTKNLALAHDYIISIFYHVKSKIDFIIYNTRSLGECP